MSMLSRTSRRPRQPFAALADLCEGYFDDLGFVEECELLHEDELPRAARELLVHRNHMTTVLEHRHGGPVELNVLRERSGPQRYSRMITLSPKGQPERVVEFGVVWIELRHLTPLVRAEVLGRRAPLGDILIRHDVLRRVCPRWYFRFPARSPIAERLGALSPYGRVGVIYCDEAPAIELLEVVALDHQQGDAG